MVLKSNHERDLQSVLLATFISLDPMPGPEAFAACVPDSLWSGQGYGRGLLGTFAQI